MSNIDAPHDLGSFQPGRSEVRPRASNGIKQQKLASISELYRYTLSCESFGLWSLAKEDMRKDCIYIDIVYLKFMHVYPCLQTVYTFKLITTLYIAELSALLLSLWNPGIQINQVLLSALQGPWPITDPTRDEERKMYRALHLWKFLLHFKILQTASGLFEMMARDGLKLKWYNQANART